MFHISPSDRVIISNQYEIMLRMSNNDVHLRSVLTAIQMGYDDDFFELTSHNKGHASGDDQKLVRDILYIYFLMKVSNKASDGLCGRGALRDIHPIFPGFDGNDGTGRLAYARFLIDDRSLYQEHNHYLNSHGIEPDYIKMRDVWVSFGKKSEISPDLAKLILGKQLDFEVRT